MRAVLTSLLVVVSLSSCLGLAQQTPMDWNAYIDRIVDLFEENSVQRFEIDWTAFRVAVERILRPYNLEDESERHEVLRQVFALLENNCDIHSSLISAADLEWNRALWHERWRDRTLGEGVAAIPGGIDARMLEGSIAYVAIPAAFSESVAGLETTMAFAMGLELQLSVLRLNDEQPRGWILDLRADHGGYISTRLIGLHPFLPEGHLYGKASPMPDGPPEIVRWTSFHDGVFTELAADGTGPQSESLIYDLAGTRFALRSPSAPIAVLVGKGTASAGEYTALGLQQNPTVRLFGQPTLGATTSIAGFELDDHALLLIAAGFMADPSGHIYASTTRAPWAGGSALAPGDCVAEPLRPDVVVAMPAPLTEAARRRMTPDQILAYFDADPVLDAALAWLRETQTPSSVSTGMTP